MPIFTIGYQGLTADEFLGILHRERITAVIDVRYNPNSRRPEFRAERLLPALLRAGISYFGIPELGIEKRYRETLPRAELWEYYRSSLETEEKKKYVAQVAAMIKRETAVLMCYERNPDDCHRLILAQKLQSLIGLSIVNISVIYKKLLLTEITIILLQGSVKYNNYLSRPERRDEK